MKTLLIAFLLIATPAIASPEDDYVACLIGQSAVELHSADKKDAEMALEAARGKCPMPVAFSPDTELDGLEDFVFSAVQAIAEGVW